MSGKIIVIEGPDASGKKTQAELLVARLQKEGFESVMIDFPQYEKRYGKIIQAFLNGAYGDPQKVSPYFSSLLYAADRKDALPKLREWLDHGKIIVMDRYVSSSKAHISTKLPLSQRKRFIEWIDSIEYEKNQLPREDLTIYLDVPVTVTQGWIRKKKKDLHERNVNYLEKTKHMFDRIAKEQEWIIIDCMNDERPLTKEGIHEKVWQNVKDHL